jgi:hypothetical protein
MADAYAQLARRSLHLRVTTRPYPVRAWAQRHHENAPDPLPSFPDYLSRQVRHLSKFSLAEKEVYIGVSIPLPHETLRPYVGAFMPGVTPALLRQLAPKVRETDQVMAASTFRARPARLEELEWLLHRSVSLGLPAPLPTPPRSDEDWEPEDFAEFTDQVDWTAVPFAPTINVRGSIDGREVERHVRILSVGRMTGQLVAPGDPWMQRSDWMPFPVEWSARVSVQEAEVVTGQMRRAMQKIRAQIRHYKDEHDEEPPTSLSDAHHDAVRVEGELQGGLSGASHPCGPAAGGASQCRELPRRRPSSEAVPWPRRCARRCPSSPSSTSTRPPESSSPVNRLPTTTTSAACAWTLSPPPRQPPPPASGTVSESPSG